MIRISHRKRVLIGCFAAALATAAALPASAQNAIAQGDLEADAPAAPDEETAAPASKGEQRLAKLLDGRTAGEPVRCIRALPNVRMQTINGVAYVYGSGDTIWVQRTRDPRQIDDANILLIDRREAARVCREDVRRQVDRFTGMFMGAVFFDDFVPYTRAKPDTAREG